MPGALNSTARRGRGRRALAAAVCVWVGILGLVVFVVGRVATDTAHWTQYLWWVPAGWCVAWAWWWIGLSRVVSRRRMLTRRVGVVGAFAATLFVVLGVWRVHRAVLGGSARGDVRVVHWNVSSFEVDADAAGDALAALDADVVSIANARWDGGRRGIAERVASRDDRASVLMRGQSVVVSRLPVLADSSVSFGWGEQSEGVRVHGGRGWVHMLALDTGGERPLVVWIVDMPSEPTRWRMETARLAASEIRSGSSPDRLRRADVVIGDFNTPRGSASLGVFDRFARSGELKDAHAQRGWGVRGSWTTDHANVFVDAALVLGSWHIDLALVDSALRVEGYGFAEIAATDHRAQVLDVSAQ